MTTQFPITNVINVSLVPTSRGLGEFNTANLLILSTDTPTDESFALGSYRVYQNASSVSEDFGSTSLTVKMAQAIFAQQPNILNNGGSLIIARKAIKTEPSTLETTTEALTRLIGEVVFCGFMTTDSIDNDISALATTAPLIQSNIDKIQFVVSNAPDNITGAFANMQTASNTRTRCLYYGSISSDDDVVLAECKVFMAAYASKALSTNFNGSNTTQTMHLKQLANVQPDPSLTQTQLAQCKTAGVDVYISISGRASVFTSGANGFFDEVFNELWFVNALQTAGFNFLAQSNTKIPQTEEGMLGLKLAYKNVCARGVTNAFLAPGTWTSSDTFGNPSTFRQNIEQTGYYIYSEPISVQAKADREDRKAPLVQIAVKTAGAVHSTNVMVYINL